MVLTLLLTMLKYYIITIAVLDANFPVYRTSLDGKMVIVRSVTVPSSFSDVFDSSKEAIAYISTNKSLWEEDFIPV